MQKMKFRPQSNKHLFAQNPFSLWQVNTCAFSSDWSKIVTGGDDMLVKLWDTKTGKVLFTLDSHDGKEKCSPFAADLAVLSEICLNIISQFPNSCFFTF